MSKEKYFKVIWTPEKKEKAIEALSEYFEKYGNGECIAQGDNAQIEASVLLVNIVDNILTEEGLICIPDEG